MRFELLDILNLYSDDIDLDYRLIDQMILEKRVKYFINTYNKFSSTIPSVYYQEFCLDVELVDSSECCSELTGCYVLRSTTKIPQVMSLSDGEVFARVSGLGVDTKSFNLISQFRIPYWGNSRYNKTAIASAYINDYIYLFSKDPIYYPQLETVVVRAIFRDPKEAGRFRSCSGGSCWSEDDTYPLEERLWEWMKTDLLANEFRMQIRSANDNENDSQQNTTDITPDGGTKAG